MKNIFNQSPCKIQQKDREIPNQFQQVYELLLSVPATRKEVSVILGIDRANVCRYVKTLRDSVNIWVVKKRLCKITKHRAEELTCDPQFKPADNQLKLF